MNNNAELFLVAAHRLPDEEVTKPGLLNKSGEFFFQRFQRTGNKRELENAITCYENAVILTSPDNPSFTTFLHNAAIALMKRHELTNDNSHIEAAISAFRVLCNLASTASETETNLPETLSPLGKLLSLRYARNGDSADLNEAIVVQRKVIQLTPDGDSAIPAMLNTLGDILIRRFELEGNLLDVDEAISLCEKVLEIAPDDRKETPQTLNILGGAFLRRFECTTEQDDINKAIVLRRRCVDLTHEFDSDMPGRLNNLGSAYVCRFQHLGNVDDLQHGIDILQRAVNLASIDDPDFLGMLNNLGGSFLRRFERTGSLSDADNAISLRKMAVDNMSEDHPDHPSKLNNLGNAFLRRFERTGSLADIDEAISAQQRAVSLLTDGHAHMSLMLTNLGCSYLSRYEQTEDLVDLHEAISVQRRGVQITPGDRIEKSGLFMKNNLANSLMRRFERTRDIQDIDEAIAYQRAIIDLCDDDHPDMPAWLNNLGNFLMHRSKLTGDVTDLDEAVRVQEKSVYIAPMSHSGISAWLSNLANSIVGRFLHQGGTSDIEDAISALERSLILAPQDDASISRWRINLGSAFMALFYQSEEVRDLQRAALQYQLAATHPTGSASVRLNGAIEWASSCQSYDISQALSAYRIAIELLPQVAWMGDTMGKRHLKLIDISNLTNTAVSMACESGDYMLAVEWLEQGRSIVWQQLNSLRTPLDDLSAVNSDLALELLSVSKALENATSRPLDEFSNSNTLHEKMAFQEQSKAHHHLAERWDDLLKRVREIEGFENFLRPLQFMNVLKAIPLGGTVIMINIDPRRCDALALQPSCTSPVHVGLDNFSYKQAQSLRQRLRSCLQSNGSRMRELRAGRLASEPSINTTMKDILSELWLYVAEPILRALKLSGDSPPRLWWCATGPLAFLPLHAAGRYGSAKNSMTATTVSGYVVSSYTPTISVLSRTHIPNIVGNFTGFLIVSQPNTPSLASIPNTTKEARVIEKQLISSNFQSITLEGENATVNNIMQQMEDCGWVHLACHAIQNDEDPIRSSFYLHDGQLELQHILKKSLSKADFAFLSACQTGKGDEKLSEEAVHLAAGMMHAGYRSIVATMWSISDEHAPLVAREFYSALLNKCDENQELIVPNSTNAAYALHQATIVLRNRLGDSETSLLSWVPYIHLGL
ncbi:CHAT domain-containing protein [Crucibulum laeve]|uniref:CHAT domain-containing protein n=1 Tax=Crucibulum laeve TaxID=68775 RepID=A0A5C3LR85_9AGAR|nr:CHAT domain-containing protein [Crucibulum laeve]